MLPQVERPPRGVLRPYRALVLKVRYRERGRYQVLILGDANDSNRLILLKNSVMRDNTPVVNR